MSDTSPTPGPALILAGGVGPGLTTTTRQDRSTPVRITIAYEGVETSDGRSLTRGKLELPTEPIPVTALPAVAPGEDYHGSTLYGTASDVRREDDGRITAVLDPEPPDWASPQIEIDMAEFDSDDPTKMVVVVGRLRAVHLGDQPAWPALAERPRP